MNMESIFGEKDGKDGMFTDSIFDWLKNSFVFIRPVEKGWFFNQVIKGLTIHVEIFI